MIELFYTPTELINLILDDAGIADLPIFEVVTPDQLLERVRLSSLKEFSVRYPHRVKWKFNDNEIVGGVENALNTTTGILYQIPSYLYEGTSLLGITRVDPVASTGFNDIYVPSVYSYDAASVITTIADVKLAATIGAQMSKAMTFEFVLPNYIKIYNGWLSGTYEAELKLEHSISLNTVPPTAMTNLRRLMQYDIESYLYNKLKRQQNLSVGIGSIDLKIDDWADSKQKMYDLLETWDQDGNLDLDYIQYF